MSTQMRLLALIITLLSLLPACRHQIGTPAMAQADCKQEIEDNFGPQRSALIAVRPTDSGPVFRSSVLESVDRVCQAFEDEASDDLRKVKCLTTVPIMYSSAMGTRVLIARDELPFNLQESVDFQNLVLQLEFARGDVVDPATGVEVTYIHIPVENYEAGRIDSLFAEIKDKEAPWLTMELDQGSGTPSPAYERLAAGGPSSSAVLALYDSGQAGGLKEPSLLLAIERFQTNAERLPEVAQSFSIADVIKLVRRGLRRGMVSEALIPLARAEISQLLLALSMTPDDGGFGPTMDSSERVALLRVNLSAQNTQQRRATHKSLARALAAQVVPGARAHICDDY